MSIHSDNYCRFIDKYGSFEAERFFPPKPQPLLKLREDPSRLKALKKFDPAGRLSEIANKVQSIEGNATLEEAQVVLLPDHCHPDKEHKLWRSQIGARVKNLSNIILCEAIDSKQWNVSPMDIEMQLGKEFEIGPQDVVTDGMLVIYINAR